MMGKKVIFGFAFFIFILAQNLSAQSDSTGTNSRAKLLWGVRFDARFDNHENDELKYLPAVRSATFFSVRAVPTIGVGWGDENSRRGRHSLHAGGSFTLDISQKVSKQPIEPVVYYNYSSEWFGIFAGKFERANLIGSYARTISTGTQWFYDNVLDGFAFQYRAPQGYAELVLDWDGIKTKSSRERFRVISSAAFTPVKTHAMRWFAMGYSFDLYHMANSLEGAEGVVDHFGIGPWIGANFHELGAPLDILSLQVGWYQMFDRDRAGENKWLAPGGGMIDFTIQKWGLGARNRLYWGVPLMPLKGVLSAADAAMIYRGDPFYSAVSDTRIFNYTYIYWRPQWFSSRGVNFELSIGLHTDGKKVGFQQSLMVNVYLNRGFFKKK